MSRLNISAEIDIKTTDHLSLNTEREKRAIKLPHDLSIEIPVNNKRIKRALQRNHHINHLVQVTVERNGHIIRHSVADEQVYYFICSCVHLLTFFLKGIF